MGEKESFMEKIDPKILLNNAGLFPRLFHRHRAVSLNQTWLRKLTTMQALLHHLRTK